MLASTSVSPPVSAATFAIIKPSGNNKKYLSAFGFTKEVYRGYRFKEKNLEFPNCINDWTFKEIAHSIINNKQHNEDNNEAEIEHENIEYDKENEADENDKMKMKQMGIQNNKAFNKSIAKSHRW
ncbi:hypothetical protein RhiirA4_473816 [Rhizophagus irregularis]|uniref:Uncharacterized protein n=1 Tax=Rhizophagus irregularis TaxID=588596 RepID=A0A2I1H7F6_9GLOM|nr:hypothetical protein RhiirA4_473816 [Rhizophagus irregularis]